MSAEEARDKFGEVLNRAYYQKEPIIVERQGKPVAVVISPEQFASIQEGQQEFWATVDQIRERIVGSGLLTNEEMDEYLAAHDDEDFVWMCNIIMAVWGRQTPSPTR